MGGFLDLERVAGIEPAYSAWKAAALPLSYTRGLHRLWWRGLDSNQRSIRNGFTVRPL